ncbi:hypothetical protein [Cryobacterium gelidum]|uniref:hypothetical protein n=1 Tax=Cryobacterium gelidum TaxID=1259164 RepID=UPI001F542989|nr:hypothetical protein [Cryobacterium gelidum]
MQAGEGGGDDLRRLQPEVATDQAVGNDRIPGRHRQAKRRAFHRGLAKLEAACGFAGGDAGEVADEIDPVAASVPVGERPGAEVGLGTRTNVGGGSEPGPINLATESFQGRHYRDGFGVVEVTKPHPI